MTDEMMSGRPRAARSAARRQHLLDTARNLFVERGFHQTGMAQIAAASGIAVGQIYRDFENKEAIVTAICQSEMTAWLDETTLNQAIVDNDRDAVMAWIEDICLGGPNSGDRRLMIELLAEVSRNPAIAKANEDAQERIRPVLATALRCLSPNASLARQATATDILTALTWGIVAFRQVSPQSDHLAVRKRFARMLRNELQTMANY